MHVNLNLLSGRWILMVILVCFLGYPKVNAQKDNENIQYLLVIQGQHENDDPPQIDDSARREHLLNLNKLVNEQLLRPLGILQGGGGVFLFEPSKLEDVNTFLKSDPLLNTSVYKHQLKEIRLQHDHLCTFSRNCGVDDYVLVMYWINLNKLTVKVASTMEMEHERYLKSFYTLNEFLMHGKFLAGDGDFVIIKRTDVPSYLNDDPAVFSDYLYYEVMPFTGCNTTNCP